MSEKALNEAKAYFLFVNFMYYKIDKEDDDIILGQLENGITPMLKLPREHRKQATAIASRMSRCLCFVPDIEDIKQANEDYEI